MTIAEVVGKKVFALRKQKGLRRNKLLILYIFRSLYMPE